MTIKSVETHDRTEALHTAGEKKTIIRAIQTAEGHIDCFGTRPTADCPEKS